VAAPATALDRCNLCSFTYRQASVGRLEAWKVGCRVMAPVCFCATARCTSTGMTLGMTWGGARWPAPFTCIHRRARFTVLTLPFGRHMAHVGSLGTDHQGRGLAHGPCSEQTQTTQHRVGRQRLRLIGHWGSAAGRGKGSDPNTVAKPLWAWTVRPSCGHGAA
jgi:hypothetical protein